MMHLEIHTCFLRAPPHHSLIRILKQEADRHESKISLCICVDGHPPRVALVHVRPANIQHAGDTGSTEVNVQDANLMDADRNHMFRCAYTCKQNVLTTRRNWTDLKTWLHGASELLTFLSACLRARANSVVMVLFPTPPLPDRTNTTCLTWVRFPSRM